MKFIPTKSQDSERNWSPSHVYIASATLRGWHLEFDSPKLTKDAYRYKKKIWKIIEKWYLHLNKWSRCWWNSESLENTLIHFSVCVCLCCIRQNPDILCKPVNNRNVNRTKGTSCQAIISCLFSRNNKNLLYIPFDWRVEPLIISNRFVRYAGIGIQVRIVTPAHDKCRDSPKVWYGLRNPPRGCRVPADCAVETNSPWIFLINV